MVVVVSLASASTEALLPNGQRVVTLDVHAHRHYRR